MKSNFVRSSFPYPTGQLQVPLTTSLLPMEAKQVLTFPLDFLLHLAVIAQYMRPLQKANATRKERDKKPKEEVAMQG
jgi:hypothetical protein